MILYYIYTVNKHTIQYNRVHTACTARGWSLLVAVRVAPQRAPGKGHLICVCHGIARVVPVAAASSQVIKTTITWRYAIIRL